MSIDFNEIIETVGCLVDYAKRKAAFEADTRIRAELERYRGALFASDSVMSLVVTTDLAVTKTKFRLLRQKASRLPPDIRSVFDPLLAELSERIEALRNRRESLPFGRCLKR